MMNNLHRKLADYLPEAVYSCDLEGRVVDFNLSAVALWGREPVAGEEFWCGSHRMYTVDGVALRHDECPMAVAIRERRDVGRIEAMVERPDGERRYVLAHPRLIRDAAQEVIGAVNVVVDITARRQAEEQLRQNGLAKDAFISTAAHELRTPLSPIMMAAQMFEATDDPASLRSMAGVIARQARVLSRLVNDLFDVSRLSRGNLPLRQIEVPFKQVLDAALDVVRPSIAERRQRFTVDVEDQGCMVKCDDVRVAQLIGNVLLNASKYTPQEGMIALSVSCAGAQLAISVRDNGIGIDPVQLHKIFELYAQVDVKDNAGKGGMGIGLSLVRELCEGHGGTIQAFSDGVGAGSRFEIRLPIVVCATARSAVPDTVTGR